MRKWALPIFFLQRSTPYSQPAGRCPMKYLFEMAMLGHAQLRIHIFPTRTLSVNVSFWLFHPPDFPPGYPRASLYSGIPLSNS